MRKLTLRARSNLITVGPVDAVSRDLKATDLAVLRLHNMD